MQIGGRNVCNWKIMWSDNETGEINDEEEQSIPYSILWVLKGRQTF